MLLSLKAHDILVGVALVVWCSQPVCTWPADALFSESSHAFPALCHVPPVPPHLTKHQEGDTIRLLAVQNTGYIEVQESGSCEGQRLSCGEGGFAGRAALGLQASCGTSLDCSCGKGGQPLLCVRWFGCGLPRIGACTMGLAPAGSAISGGCRNRSLGASDEPVSFQLNRSLLEGARVFRHPGSSLRRLEPP